MNDINTTKQQATTVITEATTQVTTATTSAMASLKSIKTNSSIDIKAQKDMIIQEITDLRDEVVNDVAVFQNNLNTTTTSKFKTKI